MSLSETIQIIPIQGIPIVEPEADVADLIVIALGQQDKPLRDGDVLVICSKVIAKAENRIVCLADITPSTLANQLAREWDKDARLIEVVLRESQRIVRMDRGILIAETHHGLVCANAGVDQSNVDGGESVCLLPADPDASARRLRQAIGVRSGRHVAVIITDSFGRPWRLGQTEVAVGLAGLEPLEDARGQPDLFDFELGATQNAIADALAATAGIVFRKDSAIAACIVRNCNYIATDDGSAIDLIREPDADLFR